MPLLETNPTGKLLEILQDIVEKVEIRLDFSIHHPDYKPLQLAVEVVERFQLMSNQMQQKYLSLQLRSFLYGIYYNGAMRSGLALDREENNLPLDLENNTLLGVDIEFYERLHTSNCGDGYFDSGWSIIKEEADGALAVKKGSLTLHIQRDKHLQSFEKEAVLRNIVSIKLPKNRVQNGFYMAVGNQGFSRVEDSQYQSTTVRIYFNLTPEGAVIVMGSLTEYLNKIAIPFSFKVLYNPQEYGRPDSGVLYFDKRDYEEVRKVLQVLYTKNKYYFQSEVPLFTKKLADGLGLAEEPDQKFAEQESFGMNRCQIVANGLLEAWYQDDNSSDGRMKAILSQFSRMGINIEKSYLNASSEDIYIVFE